VKKRWLSASLVLALIGIITSGLLLNIHYDIQKFGFEHESFCAFSETNNCDVVAASSYATFLGLPVAGLSLLYYIAFGMLLIVGIVSVNLRQGVTKFLFWFTVPSVLLTFLMAYISIVVLGVFCILCNVLYLVSLILFGLLFLFIRGVEDRFKFERRFRTFGITVLIVFAVGFIFLKSAANEGAKRKIDSKTATMAHFRGSLYNLKIDNASDPIWGAPDAVVTVVEFSDFQCPFCKEAAFKLRPYLAEFKNNVRMVYLHFPLDQTCNPTSAPIHQRACLAAYASECARKEGKFWEYHDGVFRNQRHISKKFLVALAGNLEMDKSNFEACLDDPTTISAVKSNIARGKRTNLTGTPTVFINERKFRFWRNPDILRRVIREEIARSKSK